MFTPGYRHSLGRGEPQWALRLDTASGHPVRQTGSSTFRHAVGSLYEAETVSQAGARQGRMRAWKKVLIQRVGKTPNGLPIGFNLLPVGHTRSKTDRPLEVEREADNSTSRSNESTSQVLFVGQKEITSEDLGSCDLCGASST